MKKIFQNPWPYAIIGWFALAITGMAVWITVAVRNDHELVRKDYYEAEMRFQQQMDRVERTAAVRQAVSLRYDAAVGELIVALPGEHGAAQGRVNFYRPSNSKLDREFPLSLASNGMQRFSVRELPGGLWKVQLNWTVNGVEYYFDQPLVLAGGKS